MNCFYKRFAGIGAFCHVIRNTVINEAVIVGFRCASVGDSHQLSLNPKMVVEKSTAPQGRCKIGRDRFPEICM